MSHNYFVVKSNPDWGNDLNATLIPGEIRTWVTGSAVVRQLDANARVFMWEGSPANYVIGLAEVRNPHVGFNTEGKDLYEIEYLTNSFDPFVTKEELLLNNATSDASFLKQGQASGIVSLRESEAKAIYQWICDEIPRDGIEDLWPDLLQ